jgi:hypothetical protein
MRDTFQAHSKSSAQPIRPSRFANDMEQLLGDDLDLDPLFLEESWTVGTPAALENLRRRRQSRVEREHQSRASLAFDHLRVIASVEDAEPTAEFLTADRAVNSLRAARQNWTPQDWTPQAQIAQSWIPQGWMPESIRLASESLTDADAFAQTSAQAEKNDSSMSLTRAQQLLGVTAASTREQIRSAYRRMVGQCHPDRLQDATEAARQCATQQVASLNEAYHALCAAQLEDAAQLEEAA